MKVNLNDNCRVTLTERGVKVLQDHYRDFSHLEIFRPIFTTMKPGDPYDAQLWCLINVFGDSIGLSKDPPFETTFEILKDR